MKSTIKVLIAFMAVLLVMAGCEYDVAQPQWEQEQTDPPLPVITSMNPVSGDAGVNVITIEGENFAEESGRNRVYFDNMEAEILDFSTTAITVRRPDLVNDSAIVKVVSYDALLVATYSPYFMASVQEVYGNFIEGNVLSGLTVDENENLYVLETSATGSRNVMQVTPDGDKEQVGVLGTVNASGLVISPEGRLIVLFNDSELQQVNPDAAVDSAAFWTEVQKRVKYGDFDKHGNMYVGSRSSDLIYINHTDLTATQLGLYARDEIFCVQVYQDYVYVLVELRSGEPELAIWRHAILDANGQLGDAELVLDWSQTGEYAETTPAGFLMDENGNLYVGTDHTNPLLVVYSTGEADIFYKDILPTPITKMTWGTGTSAYMIIAGDQNTVIRVDLGVNAASK